MSAASSVSGNSRLGASRFRQLFAVMASRPLCAALIVTALLTGSRLTGSIASDVAWQLWIAKQIHLGANLYTDIIETNPPLWFWMGLPVDRVASLLSIRSEAVLIVTIGVLVALSLSATEALIRHIAARKRLLLLAYGALVLMGMPWLHVGQREQIALIGTVPYAALIAARREGRPSAPLLAALIGLGGGLGFALKHYFLIVPALLELWLLSGAPRRWRPLRPETVAIGTVGIAYAAGVFLLERDFLSNIVPLVRLAYGTFGPGSLRFLFGLHAVVGLITFGFVAAYAYVRRGPKVPLSGALLVAAFGFGAAYFIQFKGWPYHAIPLLGCAALALAALLAETARPPRMMVLLAPALLLLPIALGAKQSIEDARSPDLLQAISGLPPGTPVGFISEDTSVAWSVILQHQFANPLRYNGFWMLGAVEQNELAGSPDPRLTELGRRVVKETVADFGCMPPRRIIVSHPKQGSWSEQTLDPLPFFLRNPSFAEFLGHYRLIQRSSFDVYEIVSPIPRLAPSACRPGA
jgi:hypothetical protein